MKTRNVRLETEQREQDDDPRPFRLRLLQRLADANIDIAALWKILDGTPEYSRLAALLNSMCFTIPDDLERRGYPSKDIAEARRVAAATVDSSFRDIVALAERHRPVPPEAAESPPTTVEVSDGGDTATPQEQKTGPATDPKPEVVRSFHEMT